MSIEIIHLSVEFLNQSSQKVFLVVQQFQWNCRNLMENHNDTVQRIIIEYFCKERKLISYKVHHAKSNAFYRKLLQRWFLHAQHFSILVDYTL